MKKIIVISGDRTLDETMVALALQAELPRHMRIQSIGVIIQGGSKGVDAAAKMFAEFHDIECIEEKPNWDRDGGSAPKARNRKILLEHKPDFLVVFPGSKTTHDLIKKVKMYRDEGKLDTEIVYIGDKCINWKRQTRIRKKKENALHAEDEAQSMGEGSGQVPGHPGEEQGMRDKTSLHE